MKADNLKTQHKCKHQSAWLILSLLLLLRIPYVITIIYFMPIEDESGAAVFEVGTYLLLAILIWLERDRLAEFHIDTMTLAFFIFIRPTQTLILNYWHVDSPLTFPHPSGLLLWAISIGLAIALWRSRFKPARIQTRTLRWLALGIFAGVLVSIFENLSSFQSVLNSANARSINILPILSSTSLNLLYHLGFAPINEEPVFRGFLWGYLRQLKWKEVWIWLFQAGLFTVAHVYFADQYPLMFWVYIPISALLLGFFAWRSRSLAPGMLIHALINGSVYVLALGLLTMFR